MDDLLKYISIYNIIIIPFYFPIPTQYDDNVASAEQ